MCLASIVHCEVGLDERISVEYCRHHPFPIGVNFVEKSSKVDSDTPGDLKFCCFLDILGFKSLLNDFDRAVSLYQGMVAYVRSTKEINAMLSVQLNNLSGVKRDPVSIKILSDSIILSSTSWYDVVSSAQRAQAYFFEHGFLIRGGIAFGRHAEFDDDTGVAVVSEALSRAYIAESKIAIYPRIVFDVSALNEISRYSKQEISPLFNMLRSFVVDDLGTWFLDIPFHVNEAPEKLLREMYIAASGEDIMRKIRWLIDYYNYCDRRVNRQPLRVDMTADATIGSAILKYQRFGSLSHEWVMYWKRKTSETCLFSQ